MLLEDIKLELAPILLRANLQTIRVNVEIDIVPWGVWHHIKDSQGRLICEYQLTNDQVYRLLSNLK